MPEIGERSPAAPASLGDIATEINGAAAACTGALTTVVGWKLTKVGRLVTLHLPAISDAAIAQPSFTFGTVIPVGFRPPVSVGLPIVVKDNGTNQAAAGLAFVSAAGVITIYKVLTIATNFTAAIGAGISYDCSVSWSTN